MCRVHGITDSWRQKQNSTQQYVRLGGRRTHVAGVRISYRRRSIRWLRGLGSFWLDIFLARHEATICDHHQNDDDDDNNAENASQRVGNRLIDYTHHSTAQQIITVSRHKCALLTRGWTSTPRRRHGCNRQHILEPRCDLDLWPPTSKQVISRASGCSL